MRFVIALLLASFLPGALAAGGKPLTEADVEALSQAAQKGDAAAQKDLADAYLEGNGVERSNKLARDWLEASAAQNHVPALRSLAYYHFKGWRGFDKDDALALRYLEKVDATNTAEGAYAYGAAIVGGSFKGLVNDTHRARAAERLKFAYQHGETDAAMLLAKGYNARWFGKADGEAARQWYETWAREDSEEFRPHEGLAELYDEGKLLRRDLAKALHHYTLATGRLAESQSEGEHNTRMFLSRMYLRMAELNELKSPADIRSATGYYEKVVDTFDGVDANTARLRLVRLMMDHDDESTVGRAVATLAERGRDQDAPSTCLLLKVFKEGRPGIRANTEAYNEWAPQYERMVFKDYVRSRNEAWADYDAPRCMMDAACGNALRKSMDGICTRAYPKPLD